MISKTMLRRTIIAASIASYYYLFFLSSVKFNSTLEQLLTLGHGDSCQNNLITLAQSVGSIYDYATIGFGICMVIILLVNKYVR